jgi:hypothetical protein
MFQFDREFPAKTGRFVHKRLAAKRALALRSGLLILATAAAAAAATMAGNARLGSAARNLGCWQQFGSFSTGHWPPSCWRPYGSRSPFNTPIPANARLASDSPAISNYIRSHHWSFESDGSGRFVIDAGGSRPVYWSQKSDPLVTVICQEYCRQRRVRLHIPKGAQPQHQSDGHMTVVNQAAGLEYDFWQASTPEHGKMTASAESRIPIGAGSGTGLGGGAEAADLGLLGGLIRAPELAAGRIEHALATTAECVQSRDVWPSPAGGHGDSVCANGGAGPHFASLLQLDMSDREIAATHAPRWQRAIMKAMAHYGIYVVDTNGPGEREMSLLTEEDQSFTSFGYPGEMARFVKSISGSNQVAGVPIDVSKLRVIAPCVVRRTC